MSVMYHTQFVKSLIALINCCIVLEFFTFGDKYCPWFSNFRNVRDRQLIVIFHDFHYFYTFLPVKLLEFHMRIDLACYMMDELHCEVLARMIFCFILILCTTVLPLVNITIPHLILNGAAMAATD